MPPARQCVLNRGRNCFLAPLRPPGTRELRTTFRHRRQRGARRQGRRPAPCGHAVVYWCAARGQNGPCAWDIAPKRTPALWSGTRLSTRQHRKSWSANLACLLLLRLQLARKAEASSDTDYLRPVCAIGRICPLGFVVVFCIALLCGRIPPVRRRCGRLANHHFGTSLHRPAGAMKLVKKWNKKVRLLGMPTAQVEVLPILLQVRSSPQ